MFIILKKKETLIEGVQTFDVEFVAHSSWSPSPYPHNYFVDADVEFREDIGSWKDNGISTHEIDVEVTLPEKGDPIFKAVSGLRAKDYQKTQEYVDNHNAVQEEKRAAEFKKDVDALNGKYIEALIEKNNKAQTDIGLEIVSKKEAIRDKYPYKELAAEKTK